MNEKSYKYDVAFSFLKEDEEFAAQINNILQDRLKTFLYSKTQEELVGTDGEKTFNTVFSSEARIVVVFYRKGWGETPWTRIEQTAIRNRAYKEGYDFTIFIPLERKVQLPKWLPLTQIWYDLDRWGIDAAAAIVEDRVRKSGGSPKEETTVERAKRLEREIASENSRKAFLSSEGGVKEAGGELKALFSELKRLCEEISSGGKQLSLRYKCDDRQFIFCSGMLSISLAWSQTYSNTLEFSKLHFILCEGTATLRGEFSFNKPKIIREREFNFDINSARNVGWRELNGAKLFFTSTQLADECFKSMFEQIRLITLGE